MEELFENAAVPSGRRVNLAVNALKGSAAIWGEIKRELFVDFACFKSMFLSRYWDADKERAAYQKLQFGRYERGSKAEYFLQAVREAKYLSEKLAEQDIVKLIVNHFPPEVRRGILN